MPLGLWRTRAAVSTLLTFWPPGPEERKKVISISWGLIVTTVGSTSGRIATEAVEVWTRPDFSVAGTR